MIPDAALSQHIAILGKTGSGKTVVGKGLAERLLEQNKRVCVLDPTGAWWGLKHSADGRGPGYPICVFGGDHGDVPINEHAGEALGRLVATTNTPCVIDLSGMTTAARRRFAYQFLEAVYHHNREPLHLIVDEADEFAPQSGDRGMEHLVGSFDRVIRRGRIKGFRVTMITQRPAVLNKNALTQANTLVAMRLPSSQDRKAVEAWIHGQASQDQSRDVMASLAGLHRGEGWIWAPELKVLDRVQFPLMKSFDSSKTPEEGERLMLPTSPAEIDLSGIRKAMASAVEEAEKNDPAALRSKVDDLTKKLDAANKRVADAMNAPVPDVDDRIAKGEAQRNELIQSLALTGTVFRSVCKLLNDALSLAENANTEISQLIDPESRQEGERSAPEAAPSRSTARAEVPDRGDNGVAAAGADRPTFQGHPIYRVGETPEAAPQRRKGDYGPKLLDTLAWLETAGVRSAPREVVATLAGVSSTSSTFDRVVARLAKSGHVMVGNGSVSLTDLGRRLTRGKRHAPLTNAALQEAWRQAPAFSDYERDLINAVLQHPGAHTREKLGKLANRSTTSSTFDRTVSLLVKLGVLRIPGKGLLQAGPSLFLQRAGGAGGGERGAA